MESTKFNLDEAGDSFFGEEKYKMTGTLLRSSDNSKIFPNFGSFGAKLNTLSNVSLFEPSKVTKQSFTSHCERSSSVSNDGSAAILSCPSLTSTNDVSTVVSASPSTNRSNDIGKKQARSKRCKDEGGKAGIVKHRNKRARHGQNTATNRPKRPLSAYNYFFRDERARILASRSSLDNVSVLQNSGEQSIRTPNYESPQRSASADKKSKVIPHHKISFEDLGKVIATRWRNLTDEERVKYEAMAEEDTRRYRTEMKEFYESESKKRRALYFEISGDEDVAREEVNKNALHKPTEGQRGSLNTGHRLQIPSNIAQNISVQVQGMSRSSKDTCNESTVHDLAFANVNGELRKNSTPQGNLNLLARMMQSGVLPLGANLYANATVNSNKAIASQNSPFSQQQLALMLQQQLRGQTNLAHIEPTSQEGLMRKAGLLLPGHNVSQSSNPSVGNNQIETLTRQLREISRIPSPAINTDSRQVQMLSQHVEAFLRQQQQEQEKNQKERVANLLPKTSVAEGERQGQLDPEVSLQLLSSTPQQRLLLEQMLQQRELASQKKRLQQVPVTAPPVLLSQHQSQRQINIQQQVGIPNATLAQIQHQQQGANQLQQGGLQNAALQLLIQSLINQKSTSH